MKVLLLKGGANNEREVSLSSAKDCAIAITKLGHEVIEYDLGENIADMLREVIEIKPDVVFNALHGGDGEDGTITSVFNNINIPITHSSQETSVIGMNKFFCGSFLNNFGIHFPSAIKLSHKELTADNFSLDGVLADQKIKFPLIIKPNTGGSTIDIHLVKDSLEFRKDILAKIINNSSSSRDWLIEEYISGREFTVGVFLDKALTVTEINKGEGIYDYDLKYKSGRDAHICPAELPTNIFDQLLLLAEAAHTKLSCRTISRSDFIWHKEGSKDIIYMLEINTHPGLTQASLLPEQLEYCQIPFIEMIEELLQNALTYSKKNEELASELKKK